MALLVVCALVLVGLLAWPIVVPLLDTSALTTAEQVFFERQEVGLLALLVAAFVAWKRRGRLLEFPERARGTHPTRWLGPLLIGCPGIALLVWSRLVAADDLHLFALVLLSAAVVAHLGGWAAVRELRLPFAISLLVLPLPSPLYNELVWSAQQAATDLAATTLELLGHPVSQGSMLISLGNHDFWVIETCSGLRSAELLTLMAFVTMEIAPKKSPWDWMFVLIAPVVALVINVLRIVGIVLYDAEQANASDHVAQGLVAVFVGTIVLFGLQRVAVSVAGATEDRTSSPSASLVKATLERCSTSKRSLVAIVGLALVVAAIGALLPSWPIDSEGTDRIGPFPMERAGWTSSPLDTSRIFFNTLPIGRSFHRRYAVDRETGRRPATVDLYIAEKRPHSVRLSLRSSKFGWLGPDWSSTEQETARIWQIGATGRWYEARRGRERYLVLVWQAGARSLISEIVHCMFALDRRPGAIQRDPPVIRLAARIGRGRTPAHAEERTKQMIYRFLDDFSDDLIELEQSS